MAVSPRMGTFVTLAEVLEARGSPLEEDEVWRLLLGTAEALTDISHKGPGNMCSVLSPGSMLLSASGNLAFKSCARSGDLGSFTAPEVQAGHAASNRTASEKMVVYSLGMTLYWSVDYQLPQNQPIQLSGKLNNLLLSMCEDTVQRRADLVTVLETCDQHIKTAQLPPPEKLIKQLVEDVFRDSVNHVSMAENGPQLTDRSQMVRERIHSFSGSASYHNSTWALRNRSNSTFQVELSRGIHVFFFSYRIAQGLRHRESYCSYQFRNPSSDLYHMMPPFQQVGLSNFCPARTALVICKCCYCEVETSRSNSLGKVISCFSMTMPLKVHTEMIGVEELDCSVQSPGLNPIEHHMRARPNRPTSVPDLTNAFVAEWKQVPTAMFQHLMFDEQVSTYFLSHSVVLNVSLFFYVQDVGPEFFRMLDEPLVVLELPGSIVSKKGKSHSTMRELSVVMPNGQSILVKCDVKSGGGDVFDMIVAHSNLIEHFYFGLAYIDDNEFFFLDNDTKISKVAPHSWKKVPTSTFVLFFRVKFFVHDIALLLHKLTRHQYYLQLRKDILEDRLSCHEETGLYLGALALQAEYGDCMPEVYGRNYYRPDQYIAKSVMEKRALPYLKEELLRLHANNSTMSTDESELEFLKATQQLPEYGVLFYRVGREKKPVIGELILGVCARGVIVYEVKDSSRSTSQTFHWWETNSISSSCRKFVIESRGSARKHTFVTERSKTATYLCNLCSAQHKFHNEMNSRQLGHSLASGQTEKLLDHWIIAQALFFFPEDNIVQYAAVCQAQNSRMNRNSETDGSMTKLCDDIAAKIEARIKQQRVLHEQGISISLHVVSHFSLYNFQQKEAIAWEPDQVFTFWKRSKSEHRACGTHPRNRCSSLSVSSTEMAYGFLMRCCDVFAQMKRVIPEREVICVCLKKDPKLGVGVVIVGEDTVGKYDLGVFIASIVRGGPADKDGRIRPGGRLISLNHTSLEGMTFSEAAEVMQNSPQEVTLIVTQPKVKIKKTPGMSWSVQTFDRYYISLLCSGSFTFRDKLYFKSTGFSARFSSTPNNVRSPLLKTYESQTTLRTNVRSGEDDLDEIVSVMLTPKTGSRLQLPDVRILNAQDCRSRSPSTNCFRGGEISVELKKKAGVGLGISIASGVNTGLRHGGIYIKSLVCGGAAEQDGRIQSGDRLLKVDGIRFQGFTYQQAVECLAKTGKVVTLVLERENMNSLPWVSLSPDTGCHLSPQSSHRDITQKRNNSSLCLTVRDRNTLEVTLNKRLNGLGFSFLVPELESLKGDSGSGLVRIKKLFPGQPAEESGQIQEGDVILAVNGEPLKGLSYQRVVTLLRGSPPEVRLSLCRPAPGILPPIETLFGT
ncbi:unnamed protein product [Oncorhynchus mykiss]|uniref:Uncharacterized protein n=1 Tax=Oncorhynchus mykiss TaxID=8022 RepID=A0A060WNY7_ONCMY|nr:unnamed protein product [Oncorhynchus mykiss]